MIRRLIYGIAVWAAAFVGPSSAAEGTDHEHASPQSQAGHHAVHVHGEANLALIAEGASLQMLFEAPAADIVGFESQPKSADQENAIAAAVRQLNEAAMLFAFEGGGCRVANAQVNSPFEPVSHQPQAHEHSSHREFSAEYQWNCDKAGDVKGLSTTLFGVFPGLQRIQLQWVAHGKQGAATLTKQRNSVFVK